MDKLAEILRKYSKNQDKYLPKELWDIASKVAKEYAQFYHEAKLKEPMAVIENWENLPAGAYKDKVWHVPNGDDIFSILRHLITDSDIEAWVLNECKNDSDLHNQRFAIMYGAKAAINGEIKHIEK